jgi:hypothetical protein
MLAATRMFISRYGCTSLPASGSVPRDHPGNIEPRRNLAGVDPKALFLNHRRLLGEVTVSNTPSGVSNMSSSAPSRRPSRSRTDFGSTQRPALPIINFMPWIMAWLICSAIKVVDPTMQTAAPANRGGCLSRPNCVTLLLRGSAAASDGCEKTAQADGESTVEAGFGHSAQRGINVHCPVCSASNHGNNRLERQRKRG